MSWPLAHRLLGVMVPSEHRGGTQQAAQRPQEGAGKRPPNQGWHDLCVHAVDVRHAGNGRIGHALWDSHDLRVGEGRENTWVCPSPAENLD